MTLEQLMAMPVAARTDFLEQFAQQAGLETAPGVRTESELLAAMLQRTRPGMSPDMLTKTLWGHYFKAPLLLVRLLQLFHPQLLEPSETPLRVLYVGADKDEVHDGGRWFPVAWTMLGLPPRELKLTAVGPALAEYASWEESPWQLMVGGVPPCLEAYAGTLQHVFTVGDGTVDWEKHFDIVVMHHPGFVANLHAWSADPVWADLAGFADVPIVGTSFDAADLEFDRRGLAASGRIIDRAYWNSAAHINPGYATENPKCTRIQWGGVLWSTRKDAAIVENAISPSQREAMEWFNTHVFSLIASDDPLTEHLVWLYTCPMQFDDLHETLYVTDHIRIDCRTGAGVAFEQPFAATELTRKAVAAPSLEQRLSLLPRLVSELGAVLDLRRVASVTGKDRVGQEAPFELFGREWPGLARMATLLPSEQDAIISQFMDLMEAMDDDAADDDAAEDIDLEFMDDALRPASPRKAGKPMEIVAHARVTELGELADYDELDAASDDVARFQLALQLDGAMIAVVQAKAFSVLDEDQDPGDLAASYGPDCDWLWCIISEPGVLSRKAAKAWGQSNRDLPRGLVRIEAFTIHRDHDSDAMLKYLVDMLTWVVTQHFDGIHGWGFTIEAKTLAPEGPATMEPTARKRYEQSFRQVLDAVEARIEDRELRETQRAENPTRVFLLPQAQ